MIKNSTFDVYDRMDKKALETMVLAFESDYAAASDPSQREFIGARLAIVYGLLKYKIHADWLPTPENINALPEPVRKFIHDLETNTDPAHIVRENILIKDTCRALVVKLEEKRGMVDQEFVNIWAKKIIPDIFKEEAIRMGAISLAGDLLKSMLNEAGVEIVKK